MNTCWYVCISYLHDTSCQNISLCALISFVETSEHVLFYTRETVYCNSIMTHGHTYSLTCVTHHHSSVLKMFCLLKPLISSVDLWCFKLLCTHWVTWIQLPEWVLTASRVTLPLLSHSVWTFLSFVFPLSLYLKWQVLLRTLLQSWVILKSFHVFACQPTHFIFVSVFSLSVLGCVCSPKELGWANLGGAGNTFQGLDQNNWTGKGVLIWADGKDNITGWNSNKQQRGGSHLKRSDWLFLSFICMCWITQLPWPCRWAHQSVHHKDFPTCSCHGFMKWILRAQSLLFHILFIEWVQKKSSIHSFYPLSDGGCSLTSYMTDNLLSSCEWFHSGFVT